MKSFRALLALMLVTWLIGCTAAERPHAGPAAGEGWRAIHLLGYDTDPEVEELIKQIPALAEMGLNVIVFEVDYNFTFISHPELRWGDHPVTRDAARGLAKTCRENGIRLIPEFQCVGHQSWAKETYPLLMEYPHFDLTPGAFPDNEDIYCREWDVMNPEINTIVFRLLDEIIEAFDADAMHVGMDEVFLLGHELSPSTRGKDPGELYAKAINEIHAHLVEKRGVEMLMWGDRLFDGNDHEFGEWESSLNGTAAAVDLIPKDIIICPWHYEKMEAYPSLPMFLEKGFRILPTSWRNVEAVQALIRHSQILDSPRMLGHLFTTWGKTDLLAYQPLIEGLKLITND